jgi:murein DD-endopeptidase MepM/ murein hydrolase activator NlpD
MADTHVFEGPVAERWRTLSEEVQRARHAGQASGPNETLLAQAKEDRDGLAPLLLLWAADSLVAEARPERAIGLLGEVPNHEPIPTTAELDVRGAALSATAEAHASLGDVDAALDAYTRLAESKLPGTSPARALYEAGRLAAEVRRDDDAKRLFQRVAKLKEKPASHQVPYPDLAKRALTRLDVGGAVARPHAEAIAGEIAGALRRRDGRALRSLASASHFAVGLGGHFHFADGQEVIDRLEPDLLGSEVRCDARSLKGCGARWHLDSHGWAGEWFAGTVRFTVERTRDGWEWTGISPFAPTDAWLKDIVPENPATNQPLSLPIKAPWPAGIRMRAGGLIPYIGEQAAIVAASFIPFVGWSIASTLTMAFSARDCGFGPGVLYYNMGPTHLTSVASSAFAIDFVRYLQFAPYANVSGATPVLSIASGFVTVRDAGFVSGDGDPNHPNTVHIRHATMGAIVIGGRLITITIGTPFVSRYLHMAGPNMIPVSVGMFVRQGARLGMIDDTGSSAFDHLHFSIHDDAMGGASVRPNPMDGQPLTDSDDGRCILSSNVPFP